jgi:hypothetical protein
MIELDNAFIGSEPGEEATMLPEIPVLDVGLDWPFETLEREFERINAMLAVENRSVAATSCGMCCRPRGGRFDQSAHGRRRDVCWGLMPEFWPRWGNTRVTADEEQRSTPPIVRPIERGLVIESHYGATGKGALTYEKETFEFRASLPMMLRKTLLRCRDSTHPRVPRSPLSFSARPFARPILPCRERDNCGRLSSIRDSSDGIGLSFSGGTIITAVGVTYRTCDLRRRGPLL